MRTFKALSALLTYPTAELAAAMGEIEAAVTIEALLPPPLLAGVLDLARDLATRDLLDSQERYVLLFDRTRSLSLHLFEHVHGESRDRGQAMVDLVALYEAGGFTPTASELPDFLPLFLEYASTRPAAEAVELLGQPGHVLVALQARHAKRKSPYAAVFAALVAISKTRLDAVQLARLRAEPDPEPDDLAALDAEWAEEEVRFGPDADACGRGSLAAKLRQGRRPASGVEPAPASRPPTVVTTSRSPRV